MPNMVMNEKTFEETLQTDAAPDNSRMTVNGTFAKTAILLGVLVVPAAVIWNLYFKSGRSVEAVMPYMMGGVLGGLVLCLVTCFKKDWAAFTSVPYAICEGLFLGGLSAILDHRYPGIAIQAVGLTFCIFTVMLILYMTRILQATPLFVKAVVACTLGIALLYVASMLLGAFTGSPIPYIHESGAVGIGFSLFVVAIAGFNLVLDFALIEGGSEQGAPKYMEWYGAFALMVTLVWLYVEVLRLLAKLRGRN